MRRTEDGVILVNVLVALALGAALVSLMLTSQDAAIDRTRRAAAAAQAEALALGGETSVLVALRRDMIDAPDFDHYAEPWYLSATQEPVELQTGRFSVVVRDVQGRFDLNALAAPAPEPAAAFARLVAVLDLPPETVERVVAAVRARRLVDLSEIDTLDAETLGVLAPHVSFLLAPASVNLNTAHPAVVAAVLPDRSAALRLVSLRGRKGFVEEQDLRDLGIIGGALVGLQSDIWDVTVRAQVSDVEVVLTSRLIRLRSPGRDEVVATTRRFNAEGQGALPPVPRGI